MDDGTTLDWHPDGIWVADRSDRVTFVNRALLRLHGLGAERWTGLQVPVADLPGLRHLRPAYALARQTLQAQAHDGLLLEAPDGPLHLGGWLVPRVESGAFAGMMCTVRPSSLWWHPESAATDAALQQARQRVTSIVESQSEAISRFLPDGTYVFVNEAYCRLFGKAAHELLGSRWHPVAHPDDLPMIEARLRTMSPEAPVVVIDNRVYDAEGRLRWMQFVNRGFYDAAGQLTEIQSVGRDLTALKNVEAALRESEERLELALAGSALVLWDWNLATHSVTTGARWRDLLGHREAAAVYTERAWTGLVHPQDAAPYQQRLASHLEREAALFESEHRLLHADGHWVWVACRGKVTQRDAEGRPLRLVGTLRDISQQRRLYDEGVDLLKRIESLIRDATQRGTSPVDDQAAASLTRRERQILGLIAGGRTSAQIAEHLHLSANTVASHRRNLMAKLDLHRSVDIARFAHEHGLLFER